MGTAWQVVAGNDVYVVTKVAQRRSSRRAPTIDAVTVAASVAIAGGVGAGVAVSGAGAVALNVVLTKTNAYIEGSKVTNAANVDLDAVEHVLDLGDRRELLGRGRHRRRHRRHRRLDRPLDRVELHRRAAVRRRAVPAEVQAYVKDSSISATGDLTDRRDRRRSRSVRSSSPARSPSAPERRRASASAAPASSPRTGSSPTSRRTSTATAHDRHQRRAASRVRATDTSSISAIAGAASVAFALGTTAGVSISIGVALARNQIENQIEAFIKNANNTVTTTSAVRATSSSRADKAPRSRSSPPQRRSRSACGIAGVGVSGAGADATNVILGKTNAYVADSKLTSAKGVNVTATSTATIDAIVGAFSAAVGAGVVGAGVSIGISLARNMIGWTPDRRDARDHVHAPARRASRSRRATRSRSRAARARATSSSTSGRRRSPASTCASRTTATPRSGSRSG